MGGFMLRVDCGRWGQTPDDLRRLALNAPYARTRERALALYDMAQGSCATQVAGRTGRHPQTVMGWLHRRPSPLCARTAASLGEVVRAAQGAAAAPPVNGADPAPRFTLKRLVAFVREHFGLSVCRETIRAALHRLALSWKKAKKLLGRADPEQRQAFIDRLQDLLAGAQRDRHLLVYLDEAHIHQDTNLGYGWCPRGERLWVASSSPGLSAKVSVYGLYLYNEGEVRLWPYARANGENTIEVLRRLRAEVSDRKIILLWDGAPYHRAQAVRAEASDLTIAL